MTEHPHANLLRAIANGSLAAAEEFECFRTGWSDQRWIPASRYLGAIMVEPHLWQVRRKSRTIKIGDVEVQAGITEEPKHHTRIWVADPSYEEFVFSDVWIGIDDDELRLQRGLVHLTQEPAIEMGRALAALTEHQT